MKIVVIGGSGLIGTKVVTQLRQWGHNVIAASPATGINSITGEGLAEAMYKTDIVIDLANSPSFEEKAVIDFFQTSGHNLLTAEFSADVKHHLALSIVGVDRMQNIGYMKAKLVQENLIRQSGIPYTLIRSTQFFEFLPGIAKLATQGDEVHLSNVQFQPIASDDVAAFVSQAALAAPVNGIIQIAGPERFTQSEIVAKYLQSNDDPRIVVPNSDSQYYGGYVPDDALVPLDAAKLGAIDFKSWMSTQPQHI